MEPEAEASAPPPIDEVPTGPVDAGRLILPGFTVLVALLAIGVWSLWRSRRSTPRPVAEPAADPPPPEPRPEPEVGPTVPSTLREKLRRREARIDDGPSRRSPRAEEPVIEVTDFEVLEDSR